MVHPIRLLIIITNIAKDLLLIICKTVGVSVWWTYYAVVGAWSADHHALGSIHILEGRIVYLSKLIEVVLHVVLFKIGKLMITIRSRNYCCFSRAWRDQNWIHLRLVDIIDWWVLNIERILLPASLVGLFAVLRIVLVHLISKSTPDLHFKAIRCLTIVVQSLYLLEIDICTNIVLRGLLDI